MTKYDLKAKAEETLRALMLKTNEYQNPVDPEMVGQLLIIQELALIEAHNAGVEKAIDLFEDEVDCDHPIIEKVLALKIGAEK